MLTAAWRAFGPPMPPITRDGARELARHELSKVTYAKERPSVTQRALHAVGHWVAQAFDRLLSATPGHGLGLAVIIAVLVIGLVLLRRRFGPLPQTGTGAAELQLGAGSRSLAQLRADADALAAQGRYAEAVRDRLRAVVALLEARGVLDVRPGRTASEIAVRAAPAVGAAAADLQGCIGDFNEIWYGGRAAGLQDYHRIQQLDNDLTAQAHGPVAA